MCLEATQMGLQDAESPGVDLEVVYTPKVPVTKVAAVCHTSGQWVARCVKWVSPGHMAVLQNCKPDAPYPDDAKFPVCALTTSWEEPLPVAAARKAFGTIELKILKKLAEIWQISLMGCTDLYDTIEKWSKV